MAPCLPSHLTNTSSAWSLPLSSPPACRLRFCVHVFSSSQFRPFSWMPASRVRLLKAARIRNLRRIILNASAANLNEDLISGEKPKDKKLNADSILVVGEGFCITVAAAASIASLTMRKSEYSCLVESSVLGPLMPRKESLPQWQSFFLLAALIMNIILRGRRWQGRGSSTSSSSKVAVADFSTDQRVRKLEEEVASMVTIVRVLSKQLEKLAVRFRVTRQTLRDPIQETALLAQKTSESLSVLTAKEYALEKSLNEIHHVLLGMQENQSKQLELIAALGKLVKPAPRERLEKPLLKGWRKEHARTSAQQNELVKESSTLQGESRGLAWQGMTGHQTMAHGEDPDSSLDVAKTNNRPQSTQRVDFWLNTPTSSHSREVKEPAHDVDSDSVRENI